MPSDVYSDTFSLCAPEAAVTTSVAGFHDDVGSNRSPAWYQASVTVLSGGEYQLHQRSCNTKAATPTKYYWTCSTSLLILLILGQYYSTDTVSAITVYIVLAMTIGVKCFPSMPRYTYYGAFKLYVVAVVANMLAPGAPMGEE